MAMHSLLRQHGLLHLWRSKQQINLLQRLAGRLQIKSVGCTPQNKSCSYLRTHEVHEGNGDGTGE
jgi:hypothetical protein